ncbi:hypothetical protein ABZ471_40980 [Streptomyces sp. NPDC005728]
MRSYERRAGHCPAFIGITATLIRYRRLTGRTTSRRDGVTA